MKPEPTYVRDSKIGDLDILFNCALCRFPFQFGHHFYRGQPVNAWVIILGTSCIKDNKDGIYAPPILS